MNNNAVYVDNQELLERLHTINFQTLNGREDSLKTMIEEGVLRSAFGVKQYEIDKKDQKYFESYQRKQVNTNEDIIKNFKMYIGFYINLPNQRFDHMITIKHFVESVKFFNLTLADKLNQIAINENVDGF